ncbi:hypothetical protein ColKHC_08229 [Colletotrichum higginsianum]|nr:hypothetical protein ColKHC_08229 [Colletotrichum higginsianum]
MVKISSIIGLATYVFLAAALITHGIYVVKLGKQFNEHQVNVTLGYGETQGKPDGGHVSKCKSFISFPDTSDNSSISDEDQTKHLRDHFIDELELENEDLSPIESTLDELLIVAKRLKNKVFPVNWMIAAFALLAFSGVLAIIPLFFHSENRRTVSMFLMAATGICLAFGLLALGGAAAATWSALAVLYTEKQLAKTLERQQWDISFYGSNGLFQITVATIVLNMAFAVCVALAAAIRNHRRRVKEKKHGGGRASIVPPKASKRMAQAKRKFRS